MPPKVHASDWDRLLRPDAPRRRGPIALLITVTLTLALIDVAIFGLGFGKQRYDQHVYAQQLTATPLWARYYEEQTAAAQAQPAVTPTSSPATQVIAAGNVRSEPRIVPETVIGQVALDDTVTLLESRDVDGQTWYRARIERTSGALGVGTEGWISGTLLDIQ